MSRLTADSEARKFYDNTTAGSFALTLTREYAKSNPARTSGGAQRKRQTFAMGSDAKIEFKWSVQFTSRSGSDPYLFVY